MVDALNELELVLRDRRERLPAGSYTAELFGNPERIQRKIMEEAFEVCLELGHTSGDPERIVSEAADLLFHLIVGLVEREIPVGSVLSELNRRRK